MRSGNGVERSRATFSLSGLRRWNVRSHQRIDGLYAMRHRHVQCRDEVNRVSKLHTGHHDAVHRCHNVYGSAVFVVFDR